MSLVRFVVVIGEYRSGRAIIDDYQSVGADVDLVDVVVEEPSQYSDRRLTLIHTTPAPPDSPWRDVGATYEIWLQKFMAEPPETEFSVDLAKLGSRLTPTAPMPGGVP